MKQIFVLFSTLILIASCTQDVRFNSPAMQGVKDSTLFVSVTQQAFLGANGNLIMQGASSTERLSFSISTLTGGTVTFGGVGNPNIAAFTDEDGNVFTTSSNDASGVLNYEVNDDATYSGTFSFRAKRNGVGREIAFTKGNLWKVPNTSPDTITNDNGDDDDDDDMGIPLDTFTAVIDGVNFEASDISSTDSSGNLVIAGVLGDQSITLTFPIVTGAGTYDITQSGVYTANYQSAGASYPGLTGELMIISNDFTNKFVEGEFFFETNNSNVIQTGVFRFSY